MSMIPSGYAPLPESDLKLWKDARMMLELSQARLAAAEARMREHENGLEAATLQRQIEQGALRTASTALIKLEAAFGAEHPSDILIQDGTVYRKINGKATTPEVSPTEETRRIEKKKE